MTVEDAMLTIHPPLQDPDGDWACEWRIDHFHPVHPVGLRICGADPIMAYYHCLNFVAEFIRNMTAEGYGIWYEREGDFGGFEFGKPADRAAEE